MQQLFQLDTSTACNTADLLKASSGFDPASSDAFDQPLQRAVDSGLISFVHQCKQELEVLQLKGSTAEPSLKAAKVTSSEGPEADLSPTDRAFRDQGNAANAVVSDGGRVSLGGVSQLSVSSQGSHRS